MKSTIKFVRLLIAVVLLFSLAGCASMDPTQQRMLSGGAIGAGTGAAIGAATGGSAAAGAAIGGAAGIVGGVLVDQYEKNRGRP
jgi:osmotically inducible lipoprotein OsmB